MYGLYRSCELEMSMEAIGIISCTVFNRSRNAKYVIMPAIFYKELGISMHALSSSIDRLQPCFLSN